MAADVAQYLHAGLYQFNEQARADVLTRFREALGDDEIIISYLSATDVFFMQCHSEKGAAADFELTRVIKDYIDEELQRAEAEDRTPHISRFSESNFDDLAVVAEVKELSDPQRVARQARSSIARTHIVIAPGNEGKVVKLFPLHELQAYGLLERCLASLTKKSETLLNAGLVCRAARWCPQDGHVFNGRTNGRSPVPRPKRSLQLPPFGVMQDRREGAKLLEAPKKNKEQNGTVTQWLEGIGETRQGPPDANVDIPKDAKQHLASARTHTAGRARVVKGVSIMPADQASEDSGESSESEDGGDDFAAMLQPPSIQVSASPRKLSKARGPNTVVHDEFRTSFQPSAIDKGAELFIRSARKHSPSGTSLVQDMSTLEPQPVLLTDDARFKPSFATPAIPESTKEAQTVEQKWARDKSHARVDKAGLTSTPASTARWQNENNVPLNRRSDRAKEGRLRPRHTPQIDSSSAAATHYDPRDGESHRSANSRGHSLAGVVWIDPMAKEQAGHQAPPVDASWSTLANPMWQKTGQLIDVGAVQTDLGSSNVPSGLHDRPGNHETLPKEVLSETGTSGTLIELAKAATDESAEHNSVALSAQLPLRMGNLPEQGASSVSQAQVEPPDADQGNGPIIERIQKPAKDYAKRHNTMRQKAGNNTKGKKGKKNAASQKFKVQLELPDPVPAPKKKQHVPNVARTAAQENTCGIKHAQPLSASAHANLKPSTRITKENHAFGKLLQTERQRQETQDEEYDSPQRITPRLVGRLGLLLLRLDEKHHDFDRSANDPISMQTNLRQASPRTHFLPRLTTSTDDAARLIDSVLAIGTVADSQSSCSHLELIIRETATGQLLKLALPAGQGNDERSSYTIKTSEHVRLGEACCHLVAHVWDAQVSLVQPAPDYEFPSVSALNDFVESMATDEVPPSFRAQTCNTVFTIEKVLAKRIIEIHKAGLSFKLREVQDLVTEYLDLGSYNFRALARTPQEMIEDQRYWFEAQWEAADLSRADDLQAYVNEAIQQMDDVGLENQGPFILSQDYRSDDESEVLEQPFW
ncbi:hypothetical protein CERZMDRAFT_98471 [Cercospora zeae-maydis SCOH1-5]|uniref:Uncharacterized protein n=1 Tax=Cercospora zeae-maydis SCOH1-5 TaxID=717836 RepID=A0A6A6FDM1_9PEZI|nr:hypothetical protein CERZMDRAFT_98471 [Cercospora zeae-maydis SCOH1-5]